MKKINKHVIIAGIPRSGKTTVSLELAKYGFTHYKMDTIKRSMCEIFNLDGHDWDKISPIMGKMINTIIKESKTDIIAGREYYVIDTPHLLPKDLKLITEEVLIIYVGFADISLKEKMKEMQKYDNDNYWTKDVRESDLRRMMQANIDFSKIIKNECKKYGIKFFDTIYNRDIVIKEIIKYILDNCC